MGPGFGVKPMPKIREKCFEQFESMHAAAVANQKERSSLRNLSLLE
jgi:hypothetical protein